MLKVKVKRLCKIINRRMPDILSGLAIAGVVGTAAISAYNTKKTIDKLTPDSEPIDISLQEVAKVAVVEFIPTFVVMGMTTACVIGSNRVSKKQLAQMTSAYLLAATSLQEYKNKVIELYGEDANIEILEKLAEENDILKAELDKKKEPEVLLFHDEFSDRYFESTMVNVLKAELETNKMFAANGDVLLNDYYKFLGIKQFFSDDLGWDWDDCVDWQGVVWIDFMHVNKVREDGQKYIDIQLTISPHILYTDYEESNRIIDERLANNCL